MAVTTRLFQWWARSIAPYLLNSMLREQTIASRGCHCDGMINDLNIDKTCNFTVARLWGTAVAVRRRGHLGEVLLPLDDAGDEEDGEAQQGGRHGVDADLGAEDPQGDGDGEGERRDLLVG